MVGPQGTHLPSSALFDHRRGSTLSQLSEVLNLPSVPDALTDFPCVSRRWEGHRFVDSAHEVGDRGVVVVVVVSAARREMHFEIVRSPVFLTEELVSSLFFFCALENIR